MSLLTYILFIACIGLLIGAGYCIVFIIGLIYYMWNSIFGDI